MRLGLTLAATVAMASGAAAQVTNNVAPGNLAPATDPGCVTVAGAVAQLSPPDLALGVLACGSAANWDAAADLYILMRMRVAFDMMRVTDATAHQAGDVLAMQVTDSLTGEDLARFQEALGRFPTPGEARHQAFCQASAAVLPQHDPAWMIQHGMDAFLGSGEDALARDFSPQDAWSRIVQDYMECGAG